MYAAQILEETRDETPRLEDYQVLQEFRDVFPDDIPGLPPKWDIDFTIELVLGVAPVSIFSYPFHQHIRGQTAHRSCSQ